MKAVLYVTKRFTTGLLRYLSVNTVLTFSSPEEAEAWVHGVKQRGYGLDRFPRQRWRLEAYSFQKYWRD